MENRSKEHPVTLLPSQQTVFQMNLNSVAKKRVPEIPFVVIPFAIDTIENKDEPNLAVIGLGTGAENSNLKFWIERVTQLGSENA